MLDGCFLVLGPSFVQRFGQLQLQQRYSLGVPTAVFTAEAHLHWHSVTYRAAGDQAYVEGRLFIQPSVRQVADDLAGDANGRNAFLRLNAGVGAAAGYRDVESHIGGARPGDGIDRAVAVEDYRLFTMNHGVVEVGSANQANLLASGKDHLHGATRRVIFLSRI